MNDEMMDFYAYDCHRSTIGSICVFLFSLFLYARRCHELYIVAVPPNRINVLANTIFLGMCLVKNSNSRLCVCLCALFINYSGVVGGDVDVKGRSEVVMKIACCGKMENSRNDAREMVCSNNDAVQFSAIPPNHSINSPRNTHLCIFLYTYIY